ncbi:MAG: hypothetical protein R6V27_08185, partial [Balneolaceae bacterium]
PESGSSVYIRQAGEGHQADIIQTGEHSASVEQTGNGNIVGVEQQGSNEHQSSFSEEFGSGAFALLMQHGIGNEIMLAQNGSHYAEITQNGSQNTANVMQDGLDLGHLARIEQDGSGNDATIEQYGSQNSAVIRQNGNGHSAHITQTGHGNSATVVQQ